MSNKSMFKKFLKGTPKSNTQATPRSEEEINKEYSAIASQIGARTVDAANIKSQVDSMVRRVNELQSEMQARKQLDAKNTPKPQETSDEPTQAVNNQA